MSGNLTSDWLGNNRKRSVEAPLIAESCAHENFETIRGHGTSRV